MEYIYDVNTAKSDKNARFGIYFCHMINNILELFLSTFLIAHIYSFSSDLYDYIFKVSIYEVVTYSVMLVTYFMASKIVCKTNRISVYRVSTLIWGSFVVFTVFYGENLANLIWLAGILLGLARGVYWASYNVLKQEMIGKRKMSNFSTYTKVIEKIVSIVFPITLGALIEVASYSNTAIIVLVLCIVQIAMSFIVKSKHPKNSDFKLKPYFKRLKDGSELSKRLKFLYLSAFVYGANTIVSTLIYVCIMIQFGSNLSLGIITSIIAIVTLTAAYLIGKHTKEGKRNALYIISAIVPILSVVLFIFVPSKATIIILNFAISVSGIVFKLIYDIYRNKFLKEYGRYDDIAEHQGVFEAVLAISRIVTYLILFAVSFLKSALAFNIMLFIFVALHASNLILLLIFEKKFVATKTTEEAA